MARLRDENRHLWAWLEAAIAFPRQRQEQLAATAAALGLRVRQVRDRLQMVLGKRCPGRSTLGAWINRWARRAGEVLRLVDHSCRRLVRQLGVDEIGCRRTPVLMAVEPVRMTGLVGQRGPDRTGARWYTVLAAWLAVA